MTSQGVKSRTILVASICVVLVTVIATATYLYRSEQQREAVDVHSLLDQGIAQFREGQYELSLQTLGSIPENSIEDWHLPYYKGAALIQLKDYEAAAVQLEQALVQNSNEKNTLFALGVVYYKLGNLSLSKGYFASVLTIDPTHAEAKGLMDIMARLERNSAENAAETDP